MTIDVAAERLTQSRITTAMRCMYLYGLRYDQRIDRRFVPAPLRKGTLVHAGLEAALRWDFARQPDPEGMGVEAVAGKQQEWLNSDAIKPYISDETRQVAELMVGTAQDIFRRVWKWLGVERGEWETLDIDGVPLVEYQMAVPFDGWLEFGGTLDWVARDRQGNAWLLDFKTRKAVIPGYDRIQLQAPVYQHLLNTQRGLNLVGTGTVQIRSRVPDVPSMNKTKDKTTGKPGMSRAKNIATDWPTYHAALLANGLNVDDYAEMREHLPDSFDRLDLVYRTAHETSAIWASAESYARIMAAAHASGDFPRAANPFGCRGCTHRTICEADLNGEDTDYLTATEYVREGDETLSELVMDDDDSDA